MLNITVTKNKVAANTSQNTRWGKLEKWRAGNTLNCFCRELAGARSSSAVLHCWAQPEEPAQQFPDVLLQCPSRYPEQSNATPGELPGFDEIGDLCTVLAMWWVFMVHENNGAMKPMVPWSHWFWHMSSKTDCCMGYYLAFIRLDKLHGTWLQVLEGRASPQFCPFV